MRTIFDELKQKATTVLADQGLLDEKVCVRARALTTEEAIGNPEADDFPIQKGKERLMQADFRGARGQAFTDRFGDYEGTLEAILAMPLTNNYRRAIWVAALNAALRNLNRIEGTVHCRDQGPKQCADALADHIQSGYGVVKIAQIGLQPRMVESLTSRFPLRVLDMDPANIGTQKQGVLIEPPEAAEPAVAWADLLVVTGTTLVNGTLPAFMGIKPVIFYGTTIAGAAHLMGWERFCSRSS
jgi:Putative heavy-metal chelation